MTARCWISPTKKTRARSGYEVVMTGDGHLSKSRRQRKGARFPEARCKTLLALAAAGIRRLTEEQRALLPLKFSARAR